MKPSLSYTVFLTLIFFHTAQAQKIVYSPPEKQDFNRSSFEVITKRDNKILVYKALYYSNPLRRQPAAVPQQSYSNPDPARATDRSVPGPDNSIEGSQFCIYDSNMQVITQKDLPLPRTITGVHFLVYTDFFYVFYQNLVRHTIYCMAARLNMDGSMIGAPIAMDSTTIADIHYQSQIYSVINSEDKEHILLFRVNIHQDPVRLRSIWFDRDLRRQRETESELGMETAQYLSEFHIDNAGNFIFIGMNGKARPHDEMQAALFVLPRGKDSIYTSYFVPSTISVDNLRLLVDNYNNRYILASFYSKRPEADIEGLFCMIRDADGRRTDKISLTVLSEKMRSAAKKNGTKISLDNYYIQALHLRRNGSFTIEAQELNVNPDRELITRWNYLPELREQVATEFAYFDPYENDHYYPWKLWHQVDYTVQNRYSFSSRGALITSHDTAGVVEWVNVLNTPQLNMVDASLGYKTIISNGLLYFLYNMRIRQRNYLTARSIDAQGTLDTDTRFREDLPLRDQNSDYTYFPRLAKIVDAGELILPCRKEGFICLAKISL